MPDWAAAWQLNCVCWYMHILIQLQFKRLNHFSHAQALSQNYNKTRLWTRRTWGPKLIPSIIYFEPTKKDKLLSLLYTVQLFDNRYLLRHWLHAACMPTMWIVSGLTRYGSDIQSSEHTHLSMRGSMVYPKGLPCRTHQYFPRIETELGIKEKNKTRAHETTMSAPFGQAQRMGVLKKCQYVAV
jgi:hypothetical protein